MSVDERAIMAAGNNADLYEAMFSSQGLRYQRLPFAFVGHDEPPPYYSNLTILSPDRADEIVGHIKTLAERFGGAVGVKDSFCRLELEPNGFRTLFEASWIWREPGVRSVSRGWHRIEDETDLALWEAAWKRSGSPTDRRMFNAKMGELYRKVTFSELFAIRFIRFWPSWRGWIEKRLAHVLFRHFRHVVLPLHFGHRWLVVRIGKLFSCRLWFLVFHFAVAPFGTIRLPDFFCSAPIADCVDPQSDIQDGRSRAERRTVRSF